MRHAATAKGTRKKHVSKQNDDYMRGHMYETGEGLPQDDVEAARYYLMAAELGHARAQFSLGVMYSTGRGVERDVQQAATWYRLAAFKGHAEAQFSLGAMYAKGQGVKQDDVESVRWLRWAADNGSTSAQFNVGEMYANGQGVDQDNLEAVRWFKRAANQGHPDARAAIDTMYANERIAPIDHEEAVRWYRTASGGTGDPQYKLGEQYAEGRGVPLNGDEAVKWYHLAASRGHADAQFSLGMLYLEGELVSRNYDNAAFWLQIASTQGHEQARQALQLVKVFVNTDSPYEPDTIRSHRTAAGAGNADSQFVLGSYFSNCTDDGRKHVWKRHFSEALRWLQMAAAQGHTNARSSIDILVASGRMTDGDRNAIAWYETIAGEGDATAAFNLGQMCEFLDTEKAVSWYLAAVDHGHSEAESRLRSLLMEEVLPGAPIAAHGVSATARLWLDATDNNAEAQYQIGMKYRASNNGDVDNTLPEKQEVDEQASLTQNAIYWLKRAANNGHADAQFQLGSMYADGQGIPRDEVEAVRWWAIAADNQHAEARDVLRNLRLPLETIASVNQLQHNASEEVVYAPQIVWDDIGLPTQDTLDSANDPRQAETSSGDVGLNSATPASTAHAKPMSVFETRPQTDSTIAKNIHEANLDDLTMVSISSLERVLREVLASRYGDACIAAVGISELHVTSTRATASGIELTIRVR
jgi:TPR repeat protein